MINNWIKQSHSEGRMEMFLAQMIPNVLISCDLDQQTSARNVANVFNSLLQETFAADLRPSPSVIWQDSAVAVLSICAAYPLIHVPEICFATDHFAQQANFQANINCITFRLVIGKQMESGPHCSLVIYSKKVIGLSPRSMSVIIKRWPAGRNPAHRTMQSGDREYRVVSTIKGWCMMYSMYGVACSPHVTVFGYFPCLGVRLTGDHKCEMLFFWICGSVMDWVDWKCPATASERLLKVYLKWQIKHKKSPVQVRGQINLSPSEHYQCLSVFYIIR